MNKTAKINDILLDFSWEMSIIFARKPFLAQETLQNETEKIADP